MRNLLFVIISLLLSFGLKGQRLQFSPELKQALEAVLELRYPALDSLIALERQQRPLNPGSDYLQAAALVIEVFLNEDAANFEARKSELLAYVAKIEAMDPQDPYAALCLGELYLARAGLEAKFGNLVKAAWYFNKAHGQLKANYQRYPDFLPNLIAWGALQVALGSLPDGYQGIASFLGYPGDRQVGLTHIRNAYYRSEALSEWRHYRPYAAFVYVFLNYQLQTDEQARLSELGFAVEKSPLFIYLEAYQLFEAGQSSSALALLQKRPQGPRYLAFPYLDYFSGKIAVADAPLLARGYLRTHLEGLGPNRHNYRASSMRYLAWLDLEAGQMKQAEKRRQAILSLGHFPRGADQQAHLEAQRGFNPLLIKARRLTDAGHFQELLNLLAEQPLKNCCSQAWERQEYFYRQGRAHEALEQTQAAILSYRLALAEPVEKPTYAQANSALRAGQLLKEKAKHQEAEPLLKMALKLKGYPFYEGVQQRAQTALLD